ncbi:hypothetical protein LNQ81_06370 [Myroides sp. M-43]|uniref:hypothetical protein n=1 Tax=Myroides oncorhynchi TaxID=2893756 RepID=UPI001E59B7F3|nr:hypothetical protein [Myroides oncorhynchi]MCC9042316.1 hypothetical protein [Myroides oncorhynchi]
MTKHVILIATIALLTVGCKENKDTTPTETTPVESTSKSTSEDQGPTAIPMHGTGENSSSSSNGSFKMDDDMKKNIQQQKGQE